MRKIFNFLIRLMNGEIIAADKMLHFFGGFIIASLFTNVETGFLVVFIASFVKEGIDVLKGGKFDFADIFWSVGGALLYVLKTYYL